MWFDIDIRKPFGVPVFCLGYPGGGVGGGGGGLGGLGGSGVVEVVVKDVMKYLFRFSSL